MFEADTHFVDEYQQMDAHIDQLLQLSIEEVKVADHFPSAEMDSDVVEDHLRAVAQYHAEIAEIQEHATKEIAKIVRWQDDQVGAINSRTVWHERSIIAWFQRMDKPSLKLIGGTIKRTLGRDKVIVEDVEKLSEAFITVKTTRSADKKAIMDSIKATGVFPDGADIETGEDTYKIVL
jgi:hypothetical protein